MEKKVIWTIVIGIILFGAVFFLLIDKLPQTSHGSTSQPHISTVSNQTITTPTPVSTADIQKENDIKFLSEAIKTNEEMAIAINIFNNAVGEMGKEATKVQLAEQAYQNALQDLQDEQAYAKSIRTEYTAALSRTGYDVATARYLVSYYDPILKSEDALIATAQQRVNSYDAARKAAIKPIDFNAKGLDVTVLSTTSAKAIDYITPLPVSSDLQPVKDQYLTALSSYKKGGDAFVTAVEYYNKGQVTQSSSAIEQVSTNVQAGKNQLDTCTLKIQQYRNRP